MSVINLSAEKAIETAVKNNQSQVASFQKTSQKEKLSDYDHNLYDRHGELDGYRLDTTGLVEASSYCTSNYIKVDRNVYPKLKFLLLVGTNYATSLPRLFFYDKDFAVILSTFNQDITEDVDIPEGACYFRISYGYGSVFAQSLSRVLVVKYACFATSINDDIKEYVYNEQPDGNIFSRENIVYGRQIVYRNSSFSITGSRLNYAFSGFIPVLPDTIYYAHTSSLSGYNGYIFYLNENKEYISFELRLQYYKGVIKTPSDCRYVCFNVLVNGEWGFAQTDFCGLIPLKEDSDAVIGNVVAKDDRIVAYHTGKNLLPFGNVIILGVYENHVAFQKYSTDPNIYYSSTGWTGDFAEIPVSTTFDGISRIEKVLFFKHAVSDGVFDVRALVFSSDNRIFGTTDDTFTTFQECNIWDVKGNMYWNADDNDKDPEGVRYRFHFPADVATRQNAFLWHNGPVWIEGQGGQFGCGVIFGNYSNGQQNNKNAGAQLYYTEDGINIYVQYQFGVNQRYYKVAGDATVKENSTSGNTGDDLDTTSFTGSFTSLSLRVRYNIVPSEENADPTNKFEYLEPVTVSSISGKNFTLADASGVNVGDIVVFGGTATGDYAKILNNEATTTDGGSCCFVIKSISGNVITLADAIGNPKNNLMCRHIHGVSHFGQGIAFYTGEEYPCSWMLYMMPYTRSVSHNENHSLWKTSIVSMTNSANAFQRALGLFLRPDGNILFIADSPDPYAKKLTISDKDIVMSNYGLFKIAPEDLNDSSKAQSLLTAVDAIYALYFISGILFVSDYHGKTYYSTDNGDTWKFICQDGLRKQEIIGFDKNGKRFYFSGFIIETL